MSARVKICRGRGGGARSRVMAGTGVLWGGLVSWLSLILLSALLSGCSTPAPAPVVSREYPAHAGQQKRKPGGYYRVKAGDTLYAIAWRTGLDFRRLAAWNAIHSPYTIYVGQRLRLSPPPARSRVAHRPKSGSAARPRRSAGRASGNRAPAQRHKKAPTVAAHTKAARRGKGGSRPVVTARRLRWQWPTRGRLIQSFSSSDRTRQGIKIAGRLGQAVRAAEAGRIVYSGSGLIGYGRLIIIKHDKNFLSAYGYNRKILVKEGDQVVRGERIAEMGRSPDGTPMLHFEIRRRGTPVDPKALLPNRS